MYGLWAKWAYNGSVVDREIARALEVISRGVGTVGMGVTYRRGGRMLYSSRRLILPPITLKVWT